MTPAVPPPHQPDAESVNDWLLLGDNENSTEQEQAMLSVEEIRRCQQIYVETRKRTIF